MPFCFKIYSSGASASYLLYLATVEDLAGARLEDMFLLARGAKASLEPAIWLVGFLMRMAISACW